MIKMNRRAWIAGAMAGTALLRARPAAAQAYPQRAVRIIVPYAPGGGTDVFSRLLAAQMEREFGQTLIIDNRGGGGSTIGTQAVANAQPDGYTIGMVDSAFVTNPGLFKDKLPYDTRQRFHPGVAAVADATGAVREPVLAVQDRAGADRVRQGQSGQADLCIGRHRNRHPPRRRTVPAGGGDRDRDHPLSRRRAGARRLPVGQGGLHLRSRSHASASISWPERRAGWA